MINGDLASSLSGIISFLGYLGTAVFLTVLFLVIYGRVTPYREMRLIAGGNLAASFSYGGALLGFAIPLASAISHSVGLADMAIWGGIALVIQVLTFLVVRVFLPGIVSDIPDGKLAHGVFLGIVSIAAGIINAACMTY